MIGTSRKKQTSEEQRNDRKRRQKRGEKVEMRKWLGEAGGKTRNISN